ncbi:MAG: M16 family metallopeptidase, partial [Hyphomonadaceae bacterium]
MSAASLLRRLVCAVALACAPLWAPAALAQPAAQTAPQERGVPVQEVVSPGGIHAWLVSNSTVPMIVLRAYWRGGAAIEDPARAGITGVMADMLTEGAGAMNADAFKVRLEELNMSLGFSADWDGVTMGLVTLTANRDAAFEMARLALTAPRFDAAPLERMKRQMLVAIRQRETNPGYIANLAMDQALIPDHPYARRSTPANVAAMDRASIAALAHARLRRDGIEITVVGDIDAARLG